MRATVLVFVLLGAAAVNAWVWPWARQVSGWSIRALASLDRLPVMRSIGVTALRDRVQLARENEALRLRATEADALRAQVDTLMRERQFLQDAIAIRPILGTDPIIGSVVSYARTGAVREVVVNRGSDDWVAAGDVVVTGSGALIGIVREVFPLHARVCILEDPSCQVAASVVGTSVTGLVHGTGDAIHLELVRRDESVVEGALVATSGNDRVPGGFSIGHVRSVQQPATDLFQSIILDPAVDARYAGPALILRPR